MGQNVLMKNYEMFEWQETRKIWCPSMLLPKICKYSFTYQLSNLLQPIWFSKFSSCNILVHKYSYLQASPLEIPIFSLEFSHFRVDYKMQKGQEKCPCHLNFVIFLLFPNYFNDYRMST
jgi:hypothetical protein